MNNTFHRAISKLSGLIAVLTAVVIIAGSVFALAGPVRASEDNKATMTGTQSEVQVSTSEPGDGGQQTETGSQDETGSQTGDGTQEGGTTDPGTDPQSGDEPSPGGEGSGDEEPDPGEGDQDESGTVSGDAENSLEPIGEASGESDSVPDYGNIPAEDDPEDPSETPEGEEGDKEAADEEAKEEKPEEKPEEKTETESPVIEPYTVGSFSFAAYTGDIADLSSFANASSARREMINYAMRFLGNPYVWGGESLTQGCDCSGFVRQIYAHFGIGLPRTSAEQAEAGTKIRVDQMLPGDLLFYSGSNGVYHVLMYIGDGKAINAKSAKEGIVISDIEFYKVCWACRFFEDEYSSTQASDLVETGLLAYEGDEEAQRTMIGSLAVASEKAWNEYGIAKSVLLAQIIFETDWCSFKDKTYGISEPADNNLFMMPADFNGEEWVSPWNGDQVSRVVAKKEGDKEYYGFADMRAYEDIETAICDYAAYISAKYPELVKEKDTEVILNTAIAEYSGEPNYTETIAEIIELFSLEKYDSIMISTVDGRDYTQQELELIWALVAQEDDTCYEGALAVISSVMNRADANFEGFGTSALEQLTAPGQYCYSPNVSPAWMYQRRLNGNVPEFVKQAVSDCLTSGIRNNAFLDFRSTNATGNRVQIGCNWYF